MKLPNLSSPVARASSSLPLQGGVNPSGSVTACLKCAGAAALQCAIPCLGGLAACASCVLSKAPGCISACT